MVRMEFPGISIVYEKKLVAWEPVETSRKFQWLQELCAGGCESVFPVLRKPIFSGRALESWTIIG